MNKLWQRIANNQPIFNGWLSEASSLKAEIMAKAGYHSVTIDLQHGLQDYQQMIAGLTGLRHSGVTPMVRVAWNAPDQIMKALDAGALGIICPMVNNREQAKEFANSLYFPPKGERSFGPIRANQIYDNYYKQANQSILGFAMIETKQAVAKIDEILSTEGINGLYIGPADLSLSHGFPPGFDREEPEMVAIIDYILQKGKQYKVATGIHTDNPLYALRMLEKGFNLVTVSSDMRAMSQGLTTALAPLKQHFETSSADGGASNPAASAKTY